MATLGATPIMGATRKYLLADHFTEKQLNAGGARRHVTGASNKWLAVMRTQAPEQVRAKS